MGAPDLQAVVLTERALALQINDPPDVDTAKAVMDRINESMAEVVLSPQAMLLCAAMLMASVLRMQPASSRRVVANAAAAVAVAHADHAPAPIVGPVGGTA